MRVMDKAGKQQLRNEIARHKNVKKLLEVAEEEIQRLKDVIEVKQKSIEAKTSKTRFYKLPAARGTHFDALKI